MRTGILGLGFTLSAAILAAPSVAADHEDSSIVAVSKPAASIGSSTRRAVNEFVDAYANRDAAGLAHATTGDFEVQYGLDRTGTYMAVDEDALVASWRDAGVSSTVRDEHSAITIFPTADVHVVFVTYRIAGDGGSERIALLELRGDRVARARDLVAPAPEFIELAGTKDSRAVAADRSAAQGR
jgi:hypothetical protein